MSSITILKSEEVPAPSQTVLGKAGVVPRIQGVKISKVVRRMHMYLALFLTPWLVIYALSGLVLNHFHLFAPAPAHGGEAKPLPFEKVDERGYEAAFSADADARMIGAQVLEDLGLAGSFNVQGAADAPKLVINRNSAFATHRVTYFRDQSRVLVEKQQFTAPTFLNRAHFRHGYQQPYLASVVWAVVVDLVIVGLLFWVASGIWMWWEIKPARAWGAVSALIGLGMFALFLATI